MITFENFAELVTEAGLRPRRCSPYHFQIHGGARMVNVYPTRGKIHVDQTRKCVHGSVAKAIELAIDPDFPPETPDLQRAPITCPLCGSGAKNTNEARRYLCRPCGIQFRITPLERT